jgi:hypothetical protein
MPRPASSLTRSCEDRSLPGVGTRLPEPGDRAPAGTRVQSAELLLCLRRQSSVRPRGSVGGLGEAVPSVRGARELFSDAGGILPTPNPD